MRKHNLLNITKSVCLALGILTLYSCSVKNTNGNYASIRGSIESCEYPPEEIIISRVEDGAPKKVSTYTVNKDLTFGFNVEVKEEGFYILTKKGNLNWEIPLYLKPSDDLALRVNTDSVSYQLVGENNSPEAIALHRYSEFVRPVSLSCLFFWLTPDPNYNYKLLFPRLEAIESELEGNMPSFLVGNERFDFLMNKYAREFVNVCALSLISTPRTVQPTKDEYIELYRKIDFKKALSDDAIFDIPFGNKVLNMYPMQYFMMNYSDFTLENRNKGIAEVFENATDRIKGEYYMASTPITNYPQYIEFNEKYGKYMVTESLKARLDEICTRVADLSPGAIAPDFTYPDVNGKMVSLSDFKGKVVYIDVWATWCGPCVAQFPYLKKLEKELHGYDDIVFVGVSADTEKDKEAWKKMIKEKELEGVQLFANGFSKIANDYKINGIPRFMIINKDGTIVNADAPRPSAPETLNILKDLLK